MSYSIADAGAEQVELVEQVAQIDRRIGAVAVGPQDDVVDDRGMARLAQIGRAGQQHHRAVRLHHEALEEAEAERVVAGQPVHAFLREQQDGVELLLGHLDHQPVAPRVIFRRARSAGPSVFLQYDCRNQPPVVRFLAVRGAPVGIEQVLLGIGAAAELAGLDARPAEAVDRVEVEVEQRMAGLCRGDEIARIAGIRGREALDEFRRRLRNWPG